MGLRGVGFSFPFSSSGYGRREDRTVFPRDGIFAVVSAKIEGLLHHRFDSDRRSSGNTSDADSRIALRYRFAVKISWAEAAHFF